MLRSLLLGGTVLLSAQAADAAVITVTGAFTATDWTVYFGTPPAPIDPLFLTYSATFDTGIEYNDDAAVLTLGATNIPYAINFSWSPIIQVMVLATNGTSGSCGHPPFSFCAFVGDLETGTPYFVEQSGETGGWVARTITPGTPAIPEPASWAMLIAGFGLVGATLRRRQPAVA